MGKFQKPVLRINMDKFQERVFETFCYRELAELLISSISCFSLDAQFDAGVYFPEHEGSIDWRCKGALPDNAEFIDAEDYSIESLQEWLESYAIDDHFSFYEFEELEEYIDIFITGNKNILKYTPSFYPFKEIERETGNDFPSMKNRYLYMFVLSDGIQSQCAILIRSHEDLPDQVLNNICNCVEICANQVGKGSKVHNRILNF